MLSSSITKEINGGEGRFLLFAIKRTERCRNIHFNPPPPKSNNFKQFLNIFFSCGIKSRLFFFSFFPEISLSELRFFLLLKFI